MTVSQKNKELNWFDLRKNINSNLLKTKILMSNDIYKSDQKTTDCFGEQANNPGRVLFIEKERIKNTSAFESILSSLHFFSQKEEVVIKVHVGQRDLIRAVTPLLAAMTKYTSRIHFTDDGMSLSTEAGIQNLKLLGSYFTQAFSENSNPVFLLPADSFVLNFAHTTGHVFTGYSSAINNIGFGLINFLEREKLHRAAGDLKINPSKCNGCKNLSVRLCVVNCYRKAIKILKEKNSPFKIVVDKQRCNYCTHCLICPNDVFRFSEGYIEKFLRLLVHSAKDVLEKFQGALHVNYAMNITPFCDCMQRVNFGEPINIGVLASKDTVALEKATIDLIARQSCGNRVVHVQNATKLVQVAEQIGLGTSKYKLVEL